MKNKQAKEILLRLKGRTKNPSEKEALALAISAMEEKTKTTTIGEEIINLFQDENFLSSMGGNSR